MRCINVHNVNQGLAEGLRHILHFGVEQPSRNGPVLVAPTPVITTYADPLARVLYSPMRDANPFFHFMESLWMLAGRNDIAFPAYFNKKFTGYSDDGLYQHGAYGFRWRKHFGYDQLTLMAAKLRHNKYDRRVVVSMWDANLDSLYEGVDAPCNTQAYFSINALDGRLDMSVMCRSNDILWGCYGANAVHFSFLLEYMAALIEVEVGVYRQVSNNFHLYTDVLAKDKIEAMALNARENDPYCHITAPHAPATARLKADQPVRRPLIGSSVERFDDELRRFMLVPHDPTGHETGGRYQDVFIMNVAVPMYRSWVAYKTKEHARAFAEAALIDSEDWRHACTQWLERRAIARELKRHEEEANANVST